MESPLQEQIPGQSCSPWREAHGGAGGLWELSLRRTCVEHLLEDGPCGTELY